MRRTSFVLRWRSFEPRLKSPCNPQDRGVVDYFEALRDILEESKRTSQVVDGLMLLARADSGKETLECAKVDACANRARGCDPGEKMARNAGLGFSAALPDRATPVEADSNLLHRALLILFDNAVKYTQPALR
jgi:signal transduction histidine kinase